MTKLTCFALLAVVVASGCVAPGQVEEDETAALVAAAQAGGWSTLDLSTEDAARINDYLNSQQMLPTQEEIARAAEGDCAQATSAGMGYGTYWCGATGGGCETYLHAGGGYTQINPGHVSITCTSGGSCTCTDLVAS
jgi:hypothetical protein